MPAAILVWGQYGRTTDTPYSCIGIVGTTFGYTEDRIGVNHLKLTAREWVFHSIIELMPGEEPRAEMDIDAIQAEIRKHRDCVKENVIMAQKHSPQIVA